MWAVVFNIFFIQPSKRIFYSILFVTYNENLSQATSFMYQNLKCVLSSAIPRRPLVCSPIYGFLFAMTLELLLPSANSQFINASSQNANMLSAEEYLFADVFSERNPFSFVVANGWNSLRWEPRPWKLIPDAFSSSKKKYTCSCFLRIYYLWMLIFTNSSGFTRSLVAALTLRTLNCYPLVHWRP